MSELDLNIMNEPAGTPPPGTPPAGDKTPAGTPPAAGAPPASGGSWIDTLPEDIKGDPSLAMFKDPAALAKSYVHAQKMIGADKVIIPTEKSTEEEVNSFYRKLGRPESPEKYELPKMDGIEVEESMAKGFKDVAFKVGLNPKQVAAIFEWYGKDAKTLVDSKNASSEAENKTAIESFVKEAGGKEKVSVIVDKARQAVRLIVDDNTKKFLDSSGLGDRPEMIKFFASLADRMGEGVIRGPSGGAPGMGAAEIQSKIDAIYNNPAYFNKDHPQHAGLVQEASQLFSQLNAISQKGA